MYYSYVEQKAYKIIPETMESSIIQISRGDNIIVEDGTHRIIAISHLFKNLKNI